MTAKGSKITFIDEPELSGGHFGHFRITKLHVKKSKYTSIVLEIITYEKL